MTIIATWNVNSVRSRLTHLEQWLNERQPDIALLQETKCTNEQFPYEAIENLGYNIAHHGQKSYNGVAILSKTPLEDVIRGIPGNEADDQARYIEAVTHTNAGVLRVASIYVPNGSEVGSEKFAHKMSFYDHLTAHWQQLFTLQEVQILGGDYNCAPTPLDVYDHKKLDGTVCYHKDERAKLRTLMNVGYSDAWRTQHPTEQHFSWWDYRGGSWQRDAGMRIDHLLLSPHAQDKLAHTGMDRNMRGLEKASDHIPVWCDLA